MCLTGSRQYKGFTMTRFHGSKARIRAGAAVYLMLIASWMGSAYAIQWPQEIKADEGTVVVYQPQLESLNGNVLKGRTAMAIERKNGMPIIYGVFWFSAKVETDRNSDTAVLSNLRVEKVGWPDSKDAQEQRFTAAVENALEVASFTTELSKITASLSASEKVRNSLDNIKNDPPEIIFRDELAVLLSYDGEPKFSAIEGSHYERALNTPMTVVKDTKEKYHLTSGSLWYVASKPTGPWKPNKEPPADLVAMVPKTDDPKPQRTPSIVSTTKATELIVTDGEARWNSLPGGKLLYVENTETPWLRELSTGNMYILLSGRWFRSKSQDGPWTFVRADELPKSFGEIPPESEIGGLRSSVAGTEEADQAVVDAQIPQTTAIKRSEAKLEVSYGGKPKFEKITGTEVAYAVNTQYQVLLIDDHYYAVDNGVWFSSASEKGPWIVADTIPYNKIAAIPPSSPMYNLTHLTVYESTKEVVHVGYTPGYMWTYPYYGVPVYGTGWYYPPYYGIYYYPRPPTWGLHVGYNPWTGWTFGASWGGPFFRVGASWGGGYRCCGGGWYAGGYRHNEININTGDINIGNNINIGNHNDVKRKLGNNSRTDNLYNRKENRNRNARGASLSRNSRPARNQQNRQNNLYAAANGEVARLDGEKWQTRSNGKWQDVPRERKQSSRDRVQKMQRPSSRTAQRSSFNRQSMNRQHRARQMGARRGGRRR